MELYRQFAQISVFISTIVYVNSWQCASKECIRYPQSLKLWRLQIEVSSKAFNVKAGSSFSITCDGSCVGSHADPHLRWYGPDKHWIAYEGRENRIHVEKSFSRRFQKLYLRKVTASDQGLYICRGWLGEKHGWDMKSIRLIVDESSTTPRVTTKSKKTTRRIVPTTTSQQITNSTTTMPEETTETITTHVHIITRTTPTEKTTPNTTEDGCLPPKFKCGSGECFDHSYVCDAYPDCIDASDEKSCASPVCTEDMQACDDGFGCVSRQQICDGIAQCRDMSDEAPDVCNYLHL